MKKQEVKNKYANAIESICREYGCDISVGYDMLVSSVKGYFGLTYIAGGVRCVFDEYKGIPAGFDYAEFMSDMLTVAD